MAEAKTEKLYKGVDGAYILLRESPHIGFLASLEARAVVVGRMEKQPTVKVMDGMIVAHREKIEAAFVKKGVSSTDLISISGFRLNDTPHSPDWPVWWVLFRVGKTKQYVNVKFFNPPAKTKNAK